MTYPMTLRTDAQCAAENEMFGYIDVYDQAAAATKRVLGIVEERVVGLAEQARHEALMAYISKESVDEQVRAAADAVLNLVLEMIRE